MSKGKEIMEELDPWRELIEEMTPFGEKPEEVIEDDTDININAPRALMAQGFQSKIALMLQLKNKGLLQKPE